MSGQMACVWKVVTFSLRSLAGCVLHAVEPLGIVGSRSGGLFARGVWRGCRVVLALALAALPACQGPSAETVG